MAAEPIQLAELSQEKSGSERPDSDLEARKPAPALDGGLKGWLCVAGGFCVSFFAFGYTNAFGVYQAYYMTILPEDESTIAWIGSLQLFFMFLAGLISGPLFDRYGPKVILYPCCTLYVLSIMMTSICKQYYSFLLAQGVLGGLTNGMTYTPAIAAVSQHFTQSRSIALAIFASGSSLGGLIYSTMLNRMLNHTDLGFGWSVRIVGFLTLFLCIVACLTITSPAPPRKGAFLLGDAWRNRAYTLQVIGVFLIFWGFFTPFFFLPSYAEYRGLSVEYAFDLTAILCGASFCGRLFSGFISNRAGKFNTLIISSLCSAILVFCWLRIESKAAITVFAALFGIASGGVIGLFPTTLAILAPAPNQTGVYVGMAMGVYSLAGLTGAPIGGAMISSYGTYTAAIIFSGTVLLAGAVFTFLARLAYAGTKLVA